MRRCRLFASVVGCGVLLVACSSGSGLDPEQRSTAAALIDERAVSAMIELSAEDRACAVDHLSVETIEELKAQDSDPRPVADAVVDCVGESLIAASVLRSQIGAVAPASLDCAIDELDRTFVVDLVAGAMEGEPPKVQAEIEVARVLAICLELGELLARQ
jgi:hypothetical protein